MLLTNLIRQKSYEHIARQVRRSVVTLLPAVFGVMVLFLLPVGVRWLLDQLFPALLAGAVLGPIAILAAGLYYLFCILFFYSYFIDFYLDLLVLTNDRLIHINQYGLFSRTIFEVDLYQIEDATSEVHGLFARLFGYGNITIEVAGPGPKRIGESVPNPHELRRQILDLAAADKHYHNKR